jgi:RNA polymerase sigma factor (sigma-70 family)
LSEWTPDIGRLRAFDDDEWLKVEREYGGRLHAYVARRVRDAQAREDVLQETLLGAVRGIQGYDPLFTFEQYLFGICHNRTIDHLRRRRANTLEVEEGQADRTGLEALAREEETPSRVVRGLDLARQARALLGESLRAWVQETWSEGEFVRLMVIEALFSGEWRNKDTWLRFGLRDETSVAGIKFRALGRLRELARERDPSGKLLPELAAAAQTGETRLEFSVGETWREQRVSCPARHWLARLEIGSLAEGPRSFLEFHLQEMRCPWCQANLEDLRRAEQDAELEPLLERVGASTLQFLRSRHVR